MERLPQTLITRDGVRVSLDWYRQGDRDAALVICPGFFQSKETPTFQQMSRTLAARFDVLAMDFRGHGRSSGRYTFSAKEGADLDAVLDWASRRYPHLGILGFSLGAAIVINTVSHHPDGIRALTMISAPCAFEEIQIKWWTPEAMRTGLQGLEPGAGCRPGRVTMSKARPLDTIRHLSSMPMLFVHGTRDAIVSVAHSERLFQAALGPKRLELIEGGGHAEALFRDDPERFSRLVSDWFSQRLL